ncbi:MAG TPA: hypothetical protein PKE69_09630, partial [Pyrinomonadaceae bacterium]|nr:hypothetical protein [Pyrinomonadaceae bacterium]
QIANNPKPALITFHHFSIGQPPCQTYKKWSFREKACKYTGYTEISKQSAKCIYCIQIVIFIRADVLF